MGRPRGSIYKQPARKLATEGFTAREIAEKLDITVQWVYHLVRGIELKRNKPGPPKGYKKVRRLPA